MLSRVRDDQKVACRWTLRWILRDSSFKREIFQKRKRAKREFWTNIYQVARLLNKSITASNFTTTIDALLHLKYRSIVAHFCDATLLQAYISRKNPPTVTDTWIRHVATFSWLLVLKGWCDWRQTCSTRRPYAVPASPWDTALALCSQQERLFTQPISYNRQAPCTQT